MHFPALTVYRFEPSKKASKSPIYQAMLERELSLNRFIDCAPTQQRSTGFTAPRMEENAPFVESIAGKYIARFQVQTKTVPNEALKRAVEKKVQAIEKESGRKVGKKEKKELKEESLIDLLPHAFARTSATTIALDMANKLLYIGSATPKRCDEIVSELLKILAFEAIAPCSNNGLASYMTMWLIEQSAPIGFSIDRACTLKANDESKAIIRYANHPLDTTEVIEHVKQGKHPITLAMTYDDKVSFNLSVTGSLNNIQFLSAAMDGAESGFDADIAIATLELERAYFALIESLDYTIENLQELDSI